MAPGLSEISGLSSGVCTAYLKAQSNSDRLELSHPHVSSCLNSSKEGYIGEYYRGYEGGYEEFAFPGLVKQRNSLPCGFRTSTGLLLP